jgi:hypothetical protein
MTSLLSGDDLLEGLGKIDRINILIFLYKVEVSNIGQRMAFEKNKTFAFIDQGIFIQPVKVEDTVADLNSKLGIVAATLIPDMGQT